MLRAFRDTWELGIHSYLTYLRDRLLLMRELLHESGSVFVQISDENLHHVREIMDEVFGAKNFVSLITFAKTTAQSADLLSGVADYLLWYTRDRTRVKYRGLLKVRAAGEEGTSQYVWCESPDGRTQRRLTEEEIADHSLLPEGWRVFAANPTTSQRPPGSFEVPVLGRVFTHRLLENVAGRFQTLGDRQSTIPHWKYLDV